MRMPSLASVAAALTLMLGGVLAAPALAQADSSAADAGSPAPAKKKRKAKAKAADATAATGTAAAPAPAAGTASTTPATPSKSKKKRTKKGQAAAPMQAPMEPMAPPVAPVAPVAPPQQTVIIKQQAAPVAPQVDNEPLTPGSYDDDPPTIAHTAITHAMRGKPLVFSAHIIDPSGVFQPTLYLRKRGTGDYLPIKLIGSKVAQGEYAVEVDAKLISVDLEYYIEAYDNVGNGPARVGSPENPITIILDEEKKPPPAAVIAKVEERHPGSPPAITHQTVSKAWRLQPVEINAKLVGDTGVSNAKVFFRHVGEHDFRELPMGNIGGDDYTATMPASVVTDDLEYYLEAYDKYGNGPGRSGGPNVPYQITVSVKPPPPEITRTGNGTGIGTQPGLPPPPHLVKIPFSPNPGRAAGWLFMGGFIASTCIAGGELYGAWAADNNYQQTFNYDGRIDSGLHQQSLDYTHRAKIFGITAGASLAVGIALLLIFPEHPDSQIVSGSGGDVAVHF